MTLDPSAFITAADVPEALLADKSHEEWQPSRCSCTSIREGAGGISYSLEMLGVNCDACESFSDNCEHVDWWNSLTREERIDEIVQSRNSMAAARADISGEEPPF